MRKRRPNHDVELTEWHTQQNGRAFRWGNTDCGSLVRRGLNVACAHRVSEFPRYTTRRGALRTLARMDEIIEAVGATRVHPGFHRSGDVVVYRTDEDEPASLGIVTAPGVVCTASPELGVHTARLRKPWADVSAVWRV